MGFLVEPFLFSPDFPALRCAPHLPHFFWEDLPPPAQQIADYEIDDADADVDWQIGMGV